MNQFHVVFLIRVIPSRIGRTNFSISVFFLTISLNAIIPLVWGSLVVLSNTFSPHKILSAKMNPPGLSLGNIASKYLVYSRLSPSI